MLQIDGSRGEGGGQVLRTSLTMALATGKAFHIFNIRGGRKKPGLLHQHLTAVRAAAEIGRADTKGAELSSREVKFVPGQVAAGNYRFSVGTAGSGTLVLQTVLPVLLTTPGTSVLQLEGGTHNPAAPPFEFLEQAFLPLVNRLGPRVTATLKRPGFYPAGGGEVTITVEPSSTLARLNLPERGPIRKRTAHAIVSRLPRHIAERELKVVADALNLDPSELNVVEETRSRGPGNVVFIAIESEHVTEVFTAFGEKRVKAEIVAQQAADEAQDYLNSGVPVGMHLADQLLVPLALGAGGTFVTVPPSPHTLTNIDVLRTFLDVEISVDSQSDGSVLVSVEGAMLGHR